MAQETTNYKMTKPEENEFYDVDIMNSNMDIIDQALAEAAKSGGGAIVSSEPPEETDGLWVDTGDGGVLKYYDGTNWVPTKAVWG